MAGFQNAGDYVDVLSGFKVGSEIAAQREAAAYRREQLAQQAAQLSQTTAYQNALIDHQNRQMAIQEAAAQRAAEEHQKEQAFMQSLRSQAGPPAVQDPFATTDPENGPSAPVAPAGPGQPSDIYSAMERALQDVPAHMMPTAIKMLEAHQQHLASIKNQAAALSERSQYHQGLNDWHSERNQILSDNAQSLADHRKAIEAARMASIEAKKETETERAANRNRTIEQAQIYKEANKISDPDQRNAFIYSKLRKLRDKYEPKLRENGKTVAGFRVWNDVPKQSDTEANTASEITDVPPEGTD